MKSSMFNHMVKIKSFCSVLFIALLCGCSTIAPGSDPIIVHAEQSLAVAWATLDTFVKLDNSNRDLWRTKFPEVHKFAEYLREPIGNPPTQRGIAWIESAVKAKDAYKQSRTPANKTKLITELATVDTLVSQTQLNLDQTQP